MVARLLYALLLIAPASLAQSAATEQPAAEQLKMVVILSRHGVRSPTAFANVQPPWPTLQPDWGVDCCGDLTPRGKELVRLMGAYYRDYYRDLLPQGCPNHRVYIYADNEQRTMETGRALAQGLEGRVPGCTITVHSKPYNLKPCNSPGKPCERDSAGPNDPLFHLPSGSVNHDQLQKIADDINRRYPQLQQQYSLPLLALKTTLCSVQKCPEAEQPASVEDGKLSWKGPFSSGSTASEIFLLEYGNGMPCGKIGWGRVVFNSPDCSGPGQLFRQMQEIHTAYFQETQRARYIAETQGAKLFLAIVKHINPNPPAAKLVIFAGHDTNIANIAGMFDFKWKLCDLPENDTPPAGALVFEVYQALQEPGYSVHVRYVHQTLQQLRKKEVLTRTNHPEWVEVATWTCKDGSCDMSKMDRSAFEPAPQQQAACPAPVKK